MRWEAWSDTWTPLIWKYVAISDLLFKQKSIFKDNGGEFPFTIAQALIVKQKLLRLDYTNLPDSQEIRCKYVICKASLVCGYVTGDLISSPNSNYPKGKKSNIFIYLQFYFLCISQPNNIFKIYI